VLQLCTVLRAPSDELQQETNMQWLTTTQLTEGRREKETGSKKDTQDG
jgi:hypothetical protein